jgi:hypothetical protein
MASAGYFFKHLNTSGYSLSELLNLINKQKPPTIAKEYNPDDFYSPYIQFIWRLDYFYLVRFFKEWSNSMISPKARKARPQRVNRAVVPAKAVN